MRKLLSVILVLAMVLGLVGTAFAAAPTDVKGTDFESAVTRLAALEILGGYPDGTFKPNNNITRAEVAKIMVNALGLGAAANSAAGATKFKDVPATHWASGYINLAVSRKIITGYPDGTYAPEANVSNAEVLAMLVRVLGYEPAITGDWPMNYVSKASQLGLTDGMTVLPGVPAIRGNVAMMTDNGLAVPLMVQENYGTLTSYKADPNTNLLKTYLGVTELKDKVVTASPSYDRANLKADQIKLNSVIYKISADVNADALIGHTVDAWQKNGVIFALNDKTTTGRVVTGTYADYDAGNNGLLRLQDANGDPTIKYHVQMNGLNPGLDAIYVNHESQTIAQVPADADVTLVLNDEGEVSAIDAINYDDLGSGAASALVTKITNTDDEQSFTYNNIGSVISTTKLDLTDATYTIVDANGAKMTIADVQKNDLVSIGTTNGNYWIRVIRNSVSGDVTKVTTTNDSSLSSFRVYVGSTAYKIATGAQYMSLVNGVKTVTAISTTTANDLVGGSIKAYLDAAGKIRFVDMTKEDTANFGVLYKETWPVATSSGVSNYITMLKADGTKETVLISEDADTAAADIIALGVAGNVGKLFKYTLDTNGALLTAVANNNANFDDLAGLVLTTNVEVTPDSDDYARFKNGAAGATWYYVNANTKYFYKNATTGKYAVTTWDSVSGIASGNTADVYTSSTYANRVDYVVVTSGAPATTTAAKVAFLSKYVDADGVTHFVVDEKGTEKDYKVTSGVTYVGGNNFKYRDLATLELNAAGNVSKVTIAAPKAEFKIGTNKIDSAAKAIYLTTTPYYMTDSTVYYDMRTSTMEKVDFDAVAEAMQVRIYTNTAGFATYVVIEPAPTVEFAVASIATDVTANSVKDVSVTPNVTYTTDANTVIYDESTGALVTGALTDIADGDTIQVWADSAHLATRIVILP